MVAYFIGFEKSQIKLFMFLHLLDVSRLQNLHWIKSKWKEEENMDAINSSFFSVPVVVVY